MRTYLLKNVLKEKMPRKKLRMETSEAVKTLSENVENEWKEMQQFTNEKRKLKEAYDLFYSRIL